MTGDCLSLESSTEDRQSRDEGRNALGSPSDSSLSLDVSSRFKLYCPSVLIVLSPAISLCSPSPRRVNKIELSSSPSPVTISLSLFLSPDIKWIGRIVCSLSLDRIDMSFTAPCDRPDASPLDRRGTGAYNINAGIDSSIVADPAHRGTLTSPELQLIHQSTSYKQAMQHQEEDNVELAAKSQHHQRNERPQVSSR